MDCIHSKKKKTRWGMCEIEYVMWWSERNAKELKQKRKDRGRKKRRKRTHHPLFTCVQVFVYRIDQPYKGNQYTFNCIRVLFLFGYKGNSWPVLLHRLTKKFRNPFECKNLIVSIRWIQVIWRTNFQWKLGRIFFDSITNNCWPIFITCNKCEFLVDV